MTPHEAMAHFGLTIESFRDISDRLYRISKLPHENDFSAICHSDIPDSYRQFMAHAGLERQGHMTPEQRAGWTQDPLRFLGAQVIRGHMAEGKIPKFWYSESSTGAMLDYYGRVLWPYTYKCRPSNDDWAVFAAHVFGCAGGIIDDDGAVLPGKSPEERKAGALEIVQLAAGAARWVDGAMRTLTTTDKYAAAMACTSLHEEAFEDIRVPWPAFMVNVPPGILRCGDITYDRIFVAILDGVRMLHAASNSVPERPSTICRMEVFSSKPPFDSMGTWWSGSEAVQHVLFRELPNRDLQPREDRAMRAAKRIVTGLLYTLQHTTHWRGRTERQKVSLNRFRNYPPSHRMVVVGAPIAVNATRAVVSFINDDATRAGKAPPAFQQLVRGHTKRQVCGIGRLGRKVIWIEPYWRGPEEAPILTHPYKVGGAA